MSEVKKERVVQPVSPACIVAAEFAIEQWSVTAPNGTLKSDLTDTRFYTDISRFLKIGSHIHVMPEDGSWYAHMVVRNVDRANVKAGFINFVEFSDAAIPTESVGDFEIRWRGPHARFGVVRKSDSALLRDNFITKLDAQVWAMEQARAFAA